MMKEDLKILLKKYLTIEIKEFNDMYQKDVEIKILFDGEEITSDRYNIENKGF